MLLGDRVGVVQLAAQRRAQVAVDLLRACRGPARCRRSACARTARWCERPSCSSTRNHSAWLQPWPPCSTACRPPPRRRVERLAADLGDPLGGQAPAARARPRPRAGSAPPRRRRARAPGARPARGQVDASATISVVMVLGSASPASRDERPGRERHPRRRRPADRPRGDRRRAHRAHRHRRGRLGRRSCTTTSPRATPCSPRRSSTPTSAPATPRIAVAEDEPRRRQRLRGDDRPVPARRPAPCATTGCCGSSCGCARARDPELRADRGAPLRAPARVVRGRRSPTASRAASCTTATPTRSTDRLLALIDGYGIRALSSDPRDAARARPRGDLGGDRARARPV